MAQAAFGLVTPSIVWSILDPPLLLTLTFPQKHQEKKIDKKKETNRYFVIRSRRTKFQFPSQGKS